MFLKKCFIRMTDLSTIETRRQSSFKKKRKHSFNFDNLKKIVKSFKNRHWNEKLNWINRKQKKKIKDDRNKITATETKFKKERLSKARESENHKTKFRRLKLLEKSSRNNNFRKLILSDKAACDWIHVTLLSFSQSNMLNLSCHKKRWYEMKLMKDEWRFTRHMNALKQQSLLNRWHIFKFKQIRSKWNAKIDKRRRIQTDENKNRCVSFNFASNCYHYQCCCLNEQSFKSEALLSTSIESLLTLFTIALIFCYQAIIVKSMFSSH